MTDEEKTILREMQAIDVLISQQISDAKWSGKLTDVNRLNSRLERWASLSKQYTKLWQKRTGYLKNE